MPLCVYSVFRPVPLTTYEKGRQCCQSYKNSSGTYEKMRMDLSLDFPLFVLFPGERERYEENDREKNTAKTTNSKNVLCLTKNVVITNIKYLPIQKRKKVYIRPKHDPTVKILDNRVTKHMLFDILEGYFFLKDLPL